VILLEITKAEMLNLYQNDLIFELINVNDRLYAKVRASQHGTYGLIVWCAL